MGTPGRVARDIAKGYRDRYGKPATSGVVAEGLKKMGESLPKPRTRVSTEADAPPAEPKVRKRTILSRSKERK